MFLYRLLWPKLRFLKESLVKIKRGKCPPLQFFWGANVSHAIFHGSESSCRPVLFRTVVIDCSYVICCFFFFFFFFLFFFVVVVVFQSIRVYEKEVMVRLSGMRMTIGEEGVVEMGISEVETIIIMYNTYVLYPMFIYVFCKVYLSVKFIS